MKKVLLLVALLVTVGVAQANNVTYQMLNKEGGSIILTAEPCIVGGKNWVEMKKIYSYGGEGTVNEGCFGFKDQAIHAYWSGVPKTYRHMVYSPLWFTKIVSN
jgi:hypothetical protein